MKNSTKVCLFGGALFAAGLTAQAQNFVYSANSVYSGAYGTYPSFNYVLTDVVYGTYAYQAGQATATSYGYNYYFGGLTGTASAGADTMRIEMEWDGTGAYGYGYGGGRVQQFFQVDQDCTMTIAWDTTGTDGYNFSIYGTDGAGALTAISVFDGLSGDPLSGSVDVNLTAGQDYFVILALDNGFNPYFLTTGQQWIQASLAVPAPGAMGVLGLAGLVATRRRR